jgi:hypothetical protein
MSTSACAAAVCKHLRQELRKQADAGFSRSILQPAVQYVAAVLLPFLRAVTVDEVYALYCT